MCGIIGEYSKNGVNADDFIRRRDLLTHRGPDASGLFLADDKKVALGHRRLSILDLSANGNQPMEIGDYVITFNGEVYNFLELKKDLPAQYFSGTDTEVILRGYIKHGTEIFKKLDGMFALAIYDKKNRKLVLARDRMGVKPLYYYQDNNTFRFASELQSIDAPKKLNLSSVQKFLYQNYIYGDDTIIADVLKLPSGSYAEYQIDKGTFTIHKFWQTAFSSQNVDFNKAESDLKNVLYNSVKDSLISDVPLGVFLSSGIDSTLIAALAKETGQEVRTFTIGFEFGTFDESKDAETISKILKTDHHSIYISKSDIVGNIEKILNLFNEPFGDSSSINTYFLTRFARERVKVCLSGDGADELFAGYPILYLPFFSNIYRKLPMKVIFEKLSEHIPTSFNKMSFDYKVRRFVHAAKYDFTKAHFYYRIMHNDDVYRSNSAELEPDDFQAYFKEVKNENTLNQLLYAEQKTVLEGDYLVKVDRTSMANSLEVRVPFLNNSVIDYANGMNTKYKLSSMQTKYILKKILEKYLPNNLIYRSKKGFAFPMADWLCADFRDLMTDTLSSDRVKKYPFLNGEKISSMMKMHLQKERDYNRELWGLINLVYYLDKNNY